MKLKIYLLCFTIVTFSVIQKSYAAEYYSDPASASVTLANGTLASSGWSTSASGPFGTVTVTSADDLIIQSGSTVTTSGATNISCKNLTLNGTLISSTATAILRFVGLFSGNGVLSGTQRIYANGVCTFSFNGSGTNGVQLYGNATLVGNTFVGVLVFSQTGISLNLNGYNLTVGTALTGASSNGGNNNNIFIKGHPNSNLSIGSLTTSTFSHLYFDQSIPGVTNALSSLTTLRGVSLYTTLIIYDFLNHNTGSSFFANAPGINSQAGASTTGLIMLASTSTKTAYLLAPNGSMREVSTNSLKPTVRIQQYIPGGFRKFRFLAHPFSSSQSLAQLVDSIDITGAGGGSNGFTATATNNPSAFSFNTSNANGGTPNDAGWSPFTSANTATWENGKGIRVLVRGKKGQAGTLDGTNATPEAVTLSLSGVINNGPVTINLSDAGTGATAGFNLVGNPYPSPVDIGLIVDAATDVVKTIYLRNPQTGSYVTQVINGTYVIPAYTAFFIKATAPTSLAFTEARKSPCLTCATVFRNANTTNVVDLKLFKNGTEFDNLFIMADSKLNGDYNANYDAVKLNNDEITMYSLSTDQKRLAVDYRNITDGTIIPLGITVPANMPKQKYVLTVNNIKLPADLKLKLYDKFTNTYTVLESGINYEFEVDPTNPATIGNERFKLIAFDTKLDQLEIGKTSFDVWSTNSTFEIVYKMPQVTPTSIQVYSIEGKLLNTKNITTQTQGRMSISTDRMLSGIYLVQFNSGNETITKKVAKL